MSKKKRGKSEKKRNWLTGEVTWTHHDDKGKVTGYSKSEKGIFGGRTTRIYDSKKKEVGRIRTTTDILGRTRKTYENKRGRSTSRSEHKTSWPSGRSYTEFQDNNNEFLGTSEHIEPFIGDDYFINRNAAGELDSYAPLRANPQAFQQEGHYSSNSLGYSNSDTYSSSINSEKKSKGSKQGWWILFALLAFIFLYQLLPDTNPDAIRDVAPLISRDFKNTSELNSGLTETNQLAAPFGMIVVNSNSHVRSRPGTDSTIIGTAFKDEIFEIKEQSEGEIWYLIELSGGKQGWIGATRVRVLPNE
jgi:hypothetical protein